MPGQDSPFPLDLHDEWVHLGPGATAQPQPPFSDLQWYSGYSHRHAADGAEGRLLSMHRFDASWNVWEMHPKGSEVILCTAGEITLIQEIDGEEKCIPLRSGQYAINPAGVWHTADIIRPAEAVFVTAGEGTEHRPR